MDGLPGPVTAPVAGSRGGQVLGAQVALGDPGAGHDHGVAQAQAGVAAHPGQQAQGVGQGAGPAQFLPGLFPDHGTPVLALRSSAMVPVAVPALGTRGLDVHHGRAVQDFQGVHLQGRAVDGRDAHPVQAQGIGPVGRAGVEDALLGQVLVAARVDLEVGAVGFVQPGQQEHVLALAQGVNGLGELGQDLDAGRRRALGVLLWAVLALGEAGTDIGHWDEFGIHDCLWHGLRCC